MSTAEKPRILFVDDEPRILTSMRMLFRSNYEVFTADSGDAALALLRQQAVDVIVSDQRMPGMTGIEVLRTAREINPNAMRILLTGYSDLNAIIGSINEGEIFRFVNKPWINEDLAGTLSRAVTAARASAAASAREAADAPPVEVSAAPIRGDAPAVLVVDDDPKVPPRIQAILGDEFRVLAAQSMDEAVQTLERQPVGVVISDTRVQNHPVVSLIGTLKQHHPELVSIILTERADAGAAIDLINQGQIYRFITKPISDSQCKIAVTSALRQHQRLATSPELHQRYEVVAAPEAVSEASPTGRLMDRIRGLRGLFKRGASA